MQKHALDTPATSSMNQETYTSLYESYQEQKTELVTPTYQFLITLGESALKDGRIRRAIEFTREALHYTTDEDERVYVYLSLSRMYRMMIYMQNAKTELEKAFTIYNIEFPKVGVFAFLFSALNIFSRIEVKDDAGLRPDAYSRKNQLLVALYEEAGLSAYYMRESVFLLLQISLLARKIVSRFPASLETVNYLAATATAYSLSSKGYLGDSYMELASAAASSIKSKTADSKLKLWKALLLSYQNKSVDSAKLTEELLTTEKKYLSPYDLRLISTTLAMNYIVRGKTKESLTAINATLTNYDQITTNVFSSSKSFIEWYKIPALSFMGKNKEVEKIILNSQAIFTSVDEERWQLALYLGCIITYHYFSNRRDMSAIQDVFKRFDSIHLSPQKTFMEAQLFWIGKAYLLLDLYYQGQVPKKQLLQAVTNVRGITKLRVTQSHYLVLQAHIYLINKNYRQAEIYVEKALTLCKEVENDWGTYEAKKLIIVILNAAGKNQEAATAQSEILKDIKTYGWKNATVQLEKFLKFEHVSN